ncbi:MAG: EboA domain-containing protein [Sphingobacteriaceae bacterium]
MYTFPQHQFVDYLASILRRTLTADAFNWLNEYGGFTAAGDKVKFYMAFTAIPRKTGKYIAKITITEGDQISVLRPNYQLKDFPVDRLARVWLLLQWPAENRENYLITVGQLFKAAEMNELVALYGALPVLAYPQDWIAQCAEGIRSNIGSVLEAVICDNPYPCDYLPEAAWNQLVLKAIFTEKPVEKIIGLAQRSNKALAHTLVDFAHERRAAGRIFEPQLWQIVGRFIDEDIFPDIQRLFKQGTDREKQAAALACSQSDYAPAKALLDRNLELRSAIENKRLNWETFAASKTGTSF